MVRAGQIAIEGAAGQGNEAYKRTGDPWLDLLGAMITLAADDANQRHDRQAAQWLWQVAPSLASQLLDCKCE